MTTSTNEFVSLIPIYQFTINVKKTAGIIDDLLKDYGLKKPTYGFFLPNKRDPVLPITDKYYTIKDNKRIEFTVTDSFDFNQIESDVHCYIVSTQSNNRLKVLSRYSKLKEIKGFIQPTSSMYDEGRDIILHNLMSSIARSHDYNKAMLRVLEINAIVGVNAQSLYNCYCEDEQFSSATEKYIYNKYNIINKELGKIIDNILDALLPQEVSSFINKLNYKENNNKIITVDKLDNAIRFNILSDYRLFILEWEAIQNKLRLESNIHE